MKKGLASVLITVMLLAVGCQSTEKMVFKESSKINSKDLDGNSFTKPYMSAYKDLYIVRGLEKSGKGYKSSYRCLDLNKGTFSWRLQAGFVWNSDQEPIDDLKSFEDKLYINQGNTLVNFNLENGGPVWQSREKIDYILSAEKDKVFCLSEKMLHMKDGEYRNILCYDTNSQKLLWSTKAMFTESWNVRIGKQEIAFFSSKEEPITVYIVDKKTGLPVKKIEGVERVFNNNDEPANILYKKEGKLVMHTQRQEQAIQGYKFTNQENYYLFKDKNLICFGSHQQYSCFDLNGERLWSSDNDLLNTVARYENLISFYKFLAKNHYSIEALNPKTGATMWTEQIILSSTPAMIVIDNYAVYPTSYDKIVVRSIETGEVVQVIKDVNGFFSVWRIPGFGFMIAGKDGYLHFYKSVNDLPDKH